MNKIKFVRYYKSYGSDAWNIIYESGRLRIIIDEPLPKTAQRFCINATYKKEQYDILHGKETIWHN